MAVRTTTLGRQGRLATTLAQIYQARWAYFFIAPAYFFFIIFILYPLLQGLFLSFFKADLSPNRSITMFGC